MTFNTEDKDKNKKFLSETFLICLRNSLFSKAFQMSRILLLTLEATRNFTRPREYLTIIGKVNTL